MELKFGPNGILMIDDAVITHKNFSGRGDKYNREGDRNFSLVITSQEVADALLNDVNEHGVGWNVKIKPPRDEDAAPFMFLPVKVKFNDRGPKVYLITGNRKNELDEDSVGILDDVDIESVDLDIRPYDGIMSGKPFRSAYLQGIHVVQKIDRFAARYED
jgi:hypothetical protein